MLETSRCWFLVMQEALANQGEFQPDHPDWLKVFLQ